MRSVQTPRPKALNVSGVGSGSQQCTHDCTVPVTLQRAVGVHHYISQTLRYHEVSGRRFHGTARPKTPSSGSSSLPTLEEASESEDLSDSHDEGMSREAIIANVTAAEEARQARLLQQGEQTTAIPEGLLEPSVAWVAGDTDTNVQQAYNRARIEWITGPFAKHGNREQNEE